MTDIDHLQSLCDRGGIVTLEPRPYVLDQGRSVVITKPCIVQGQGNTSIVGKGLHTGDLFTVNAGSLVVSDLTMQNTVGYFCIHAYVPVHVERCSFDSINPIHCPTGSVSLRDSSLRFGQAGSNKGHGVYTYPDVPALIENTRFVGVDDTLGFGFHSYNPAAKVGAQTILRGCDFRGGRAAITNPLAWTLFDACEFHGVEIYLCGSGAMFSDCGGENWRITPCVATPGPCVTRDCRGIVRPSPASSEGGGTVK